jgi:hypothetical protein
LSDAVTQVLTELITEAKNLRIYRENGTVYHEKCAEILERISLALDPIDVAKLTDDQASILNSINKIIVAEEQFARASFENRSPDAWKGFLND